MPVRAVAGVAAALLTLATLGSPHAPSPPGAALVDQNGTAFTARTLRGEPLAVTFVSAHCTDACPLIDAQFSAAARILARRHLHARLLTITLDPERDSLADMRRIARTFDADRRVWIVAGGSIPNVHVWMTAFDVKVARDRQGYADMHTTLVTLLDARGRVRDTLLPSGDLSAQLTSAFERNSRVAAR